MVNGEKTIGPEDFSDLLQAVNAAAANWYNALPDAPDTTTPTTPPDTKPLTTGTTVLSASAIQFAWAAPTTPPQNTITDVRVGRDGTDNTTAGPWTTNGTVALIGWSRTFDKLLPNTAYTFTVTLTYADGTTRTGTATTTTNKATTTTPGDTTGNGIGWDAGVFAENNVTALGRFQRWFGRNVGHVAVFPTRDAGPDALTNRWYLDVAARSTTNAISVALPITLNGYNDDLSAQFATMAGHWKSDGRKVYCRLGWEWNLPQYPWAVTDANIERFRANWVKYTNVFRKTLGTQVIMCYNPNIGAAQTGFTGSLLDPWVDGYVDAAGPDAYDCWPPFNSDANVREQLDREYGLNWWANTCSAKGVPFILPEWGVSAGTQWAGHCGGDNPRYINEIRAFLERTEATGPGVLFDTYFNDPAAYLKSDIVSQNPGAGMAYKKLWTPA